MFARLGTGAYAFDSRTVEAEASRSVLSRQPGPYRKATKSSPNKACRELFTNVSFYCLSVGRTGYLDNVNLETALM